MSKKKPRKPLQRKTPMKRTPMKKAKKRMNSISPKQRKILEGIRDLRAAYREANPHCCLCGASPSCVHEITSGSYGRSKGITEPAVWLPLCWNCNSNVVDCNTTWPKVRQLAVKQVLFPKEYDLAKANACYDGTFYQEDVDAYDEEIRKLLGLE